MNRSLSLAAVILAVAFSATACDDNPPTTPSPNVIPNPTFRATLSGANEVPAITGVEAGGSGVMNITINASRDSAGTIIAAGMDFTGTLTGLPNGTVITAAHIHPGVAGVNGGVVVNLALTAGEITLTNGSGTITKTGIAVSVDQANQIINNPAAFYFNAHTAINPGGVVRGQLVRTN